MLGGEISVTSHEGEGSIFAVTLPFEIEGRLAPAGEAEIPLTDPDRTALVIDTDPASLYLTKKYLTEAGYSVAATDDPARGAEIAGKAKPAVITIDLDALDGDAAIIERIANSHREGTVVAFSADAGAEGRALAAGARVFLHKPIERNALIAVLERAKSPALKCVLVVDDDPDALDLAVAMIDGRPAKKPSFWVKRVDFVRQYQKVDGFWLPSRDETQVDVKLYGKRVFTIDHGQDQLIVGRQCLQHASRQIGRHETSFARAVTFRCCLRKLTLHPAILAFSQLRRRQLGPALRTTKQVEASVSRDLCEPAFH